MEEDIITLIDTVQEYYECMHEYFSDSDYDADGHLAHADANLYVLLYELRKRYKE